MEAIPNIGGYSNGSPNGRSHAEASVDHFEQHRYVRQLWRTGSGPPEDGQLRMVELLAHAGLLVPKGMVLSREAHSTFLEQSGILQDLQTRPSSGDEDAGSRAIWVRISHRSRSMIDGELNREICDALIGLGASSVAVVSEGLIKRGLETIPEVKDAKREAWLSLKGIQRQLEAVSRGEEIPTWSVLIFAEANYDATPQSE